MSRRVLVSQFMRFSCHYNSGGKAVVKSKAPTIVTEDSRKNGGRIEELTNFAGKIKENVARLDIDDDFSSVFGSGYVRDMSERKSVAEMEDQFDRSGHLPNRFRSIIYNEGELDNSDFSKPPTPTNPHPFDPSSLPPTHSRSLSAYVNHLPVLQRLVDIGVNLYNVDLEPRIGQHLIHLDWKTEVRPKIGWLVKEIGVDVTSIGDYLTRNPYFLLQDVADMRERINFLYARGFQKQEITKIVTESRYWLNTDVKIIGRRLGYLQTQFRLSSTQLRKIIVKEPRIISFGIGPIQRIAMLLSEEFLFDLGSLRTMLSEDPRIFMTETGHLKASLQYFTKVMGLSMNQIIDHPISIRHPVSGIRLRHEFLLRISKAQYNPELPNYVPLKDVLHPSDKYFSERVCHILLSSYQDFVKTL